MSDIPGPLVVDTGSFAIKAGFAGEKLPKTTIPSIVAKDKIKRITYGTGYKDTYVGEEAIEREKTWTLFSPIEAGTITNWQKMEDLWHHTFYNGLRVAPEEHCLVLTETPLTSKQDAEKICQIMFETFNVCGFYLSKQPTLALYTSGRTTGVVLQSGHEITSAVSIYEGIADGIVNLPLSGKELNSYLAKLLGEIGYPLISRKELDFARQIKENHCYCSLDYDVEVGKDDKDITKSFELPDGQVITFGNERFKCPEILLNPLRYGLEDLGIHEMINSSISKMDLSLTKILYKNIVLAGGSTMFQALEERLTKELKNCTPAEYPVQIVAPAQRSVSTWIGGSMFGSLDTFDKSAITLKDYDEAGPSVIHTKCI